MASPSTEIHMPTTKTQHVIDDITARIRSGEWPSDTKLPSARLMRAQYHVSQQTIRTAIERLKAARLVVTIPGAGVYVA